MDNKKLGKKLKEIRILKNLTQEKVAELSEISINEYGKIERGEVSCILINLAKIAKSLNTSLDFLIYEKERSDNKNTIHKLIQDLNINTSFHAEEIINNYFEIINQKSL